jgi:hypothetical protein
MARYLAEAAELELADAAVPGAALGRRASPKRLIVHLPAPDRARQGYLLRYAQMGCIKGG